MTVFEEDGVVDYIKKRGLERPYLKAKKYLELGYFRNVDLRKRKPKEAGIYYFKVDKKYRAIGYIEHGNFIVTEISDHQ